MYREMPPDAFQPHDTWIIAFCPDTDSFFATDQRAFYWEYTKEFESEKAAIEYFETHIGDFRTIRDELMKDMFFADLHKGKPILFENTKKQYS